MKKEEKIRGLIKKESYQCNNCYARWKKSNDKILLDHIGRVENEVWFFMLKNL